MSAYYDKDEYGEDEWDEYESLWNDDEWDDGICSPQRCGDCWGGDGICMAEIEQMAQEAELFATKYVTNDVKCPGCETSLTRYRIPTDRLWVWPGEWPDGEYFSPMIALDILAVMDAPKGEVHAPVDYIVPTSKGRGKMYRFHHIWVGIGEYQRESLIMLDIPEGETSEQKDPVGF